MSKPFISVYNYGLSVYQELERMTIRDEKTFKYNPTAEEVKAGFYGIDHGVLALSIGLLNVCLFLMKQYSIYRRDGYMQ